MFPTSVKNIPTQNQVGLVYCCKAPNCRSWSHLPPMFFSWTRVATPLNMVSAKAQTQLSWSSPQ